MKAVTIMKDGDNKIRSIRSTEKNKKSLSNHSMRFSSKKQKNKNKHNKNAIGGRGARGIITLAASAAVVEEAKEADHRIKEPYQIIDGDNKTSGDQQTEEEGRCSTTTSHHAFVINDDDNNQGYNSDDDDTQPGAYHEGGTGQSIDDLDSSPLEETTRTTTTNNNNESLMITAELAPDIDEEVARRLEERGRDIIDEEINRQLEERVGKTVVATKVVSSDEQRNVQRKRILAAVLFTAFVSFLLAFFLMKRRQENGKTSSPTPSPTLTEFEYIRQAVMEHLSYDDETLFYNESTAQYKAIEWLLHNDTLQLHQSSNSGRPMSAALLVERYVLAMIYFNNGGPYWTNSYNFLNESVSVCEWNLGTSTSDGVQCDDSGNVVDLILKLGKERCNCRPLDFLE